jgi:AraC-like DNA-binding protein
MIFRLHRPVFPLKGFVESLVYFEGMSPPHALDRFLPDGNTELIISLSDEPQYIHDNATLRVVQSCHRSWVSGVRAQPITIPSGRDSRMLVVAFRKGAAHPFYPFPMNEIMDTVVNADLVFGRGILSLREQLLEARSVDAMFYLVERFLLQQAGDRVNSGNASRCVEYAIDYLARGLYDASLQSLAEAIGYSQKHFIGLFKRQVGATPKQYLRILRFQRAVQGLETASSPDWSGFALQNGFYDQAHFINDFRGFSGFSPAEYLRLKAGTLNYVPAL